MESKFNKTENHGTQLAEFIRMHEAGTAFKVEGLESLEGLRTILLIGEEKLKLFKALKAKTDPQHAEGTDFSKIFSVTSEYLGSKEDPLDIAVLEEQIKALHDSTHVLIVRTYSRVIRALQKSEKGKDLLDHALVVRASEPVSEGQHVHHLTWVNGESRDSQRDVDALLEVLEFFANE